MPYPHLAHSARKQKSKAANPALYTRDHDLPALVPMWPKQLADRSEKGTRWIVKALEKAVRQERCRGQGGHWSYDVSRHMGLVRALKAEKLFLAKAERKAKLKSV